MSEQDRVRLVADSLANLDYSTWNFGDSVAFEAMLAASDALQDERYAAFARGWVRAWASRAEPFRRLDCTAPGRAIVRLASRFDDGRLIEVAVRLADYLRSRPTLDSVYLTWEHSPLVRPCGPAELRAEEAALLADPPPGVFVDCLHFDPPFLTALGEATRCERYWRDGLRQAAGYVRLLQHESGLFDHFVLEGVAGTFGPGWGRGQGWAVLGLLDVLDTARRLPLEDHDRDTIAELDDATRRLLAALQRLQRPDGHWWSVVNDPDSGEEYSTAAFFAAAVPRAVRLGLADAYEVAEPQRRAQQAVRTAIGPGGTLAEVSAAVLACTEPSHYANVPRGFRVPWGQGPALLALASEPPTVQEMLTA